MIRIGISGWRYEPWRGVFYPEGLQQRRELEFVARQFPTVEINGSFYSLQRPEYYQAWYDETPPDFLFAVKGSRYITHLLRLNKVDKPLANFFASGIFNLREKLGPFLWQFPPMFRFDAARLAAFFDRLPRDTHAALSLARKRDARLTGRARLAIDARRELRHAVEVRHPSFVNNREFIALLKHHDIGLVVADTAGKWPKLFDVTADFVYVRLHGDVKIYTSGYTKHALARWARRIRAWDRAGKDVYVYFDNDVKVKAPYDALNLMRMLGSRWLDSPGVEKRIPRLKLAYGPRVTMGPWKGMSSAASRGAGRRG
ncbi:MAG TPA: DUF72 domain-containing protein [Burkholderiales bacterium]|nr:DUF72 domain-containing protein [Burkholderiales bacterium]